MTVDASDPWQVHLLDLDAYLARLGVPAAPPSREALDTLHEAHVRAFTFDNIDVLLDRLAVPPPFGPGRQRPRMGPRALA